MKELLEIMKARDKELLERFCQSGAFMSTDGKEIRGVCKPVDVNVMLNFMHTYDGLIAEQVTKIIKDI